MHIDGIVNRAGYAANLPSETGSAPAASTYSDVESARQMAVSALHNDRFRLVLDAISKPGVTDAFLTMQSERWDKGSDDRSAFAGYAENSGE